VLCARREKRQKREVRSVRGDLREESERAYHVKKEKRRILLR
jgi:hypothetical protein